MPHEKPTEKQMALVEALTDLILGYSIEEILEGIATLCRMGEDNHNSTKDYGRAGTYAHYAQTIEQLFED